MRKYRNDRETTNEYGQIEQYAEWFGRPSFSGVKGATFRFAAKDAGPLYEECLKALAVTSAAKPPTVYVTGEPETYFTLPAAAVVTRSGKRYRLRGVLCVEDRKWIFYVHKVR